MGATVPDAEAGNAGDGVLATLSFAVTDGFADSTALVITGIRFNRPDGSEDQRTVRSVAFLTSAQVEALSGDFDGSGRVDFADFLLFADAFGSANPRFDLDGDGRVDFADFFVLADFFGAADRGKLMALARVFLELPLSSGLAQNYPNPFNTATTIPYRLDEPGRVRLEIFNLSGQRIHTLIDAEKRPGIHQVTWDGTDRNGAQMSTGPYLARLQTGAFTQVRKMLLLK